MKKIYIVLFAITLAFVSCDQDNMGVIYEEETNYVAFVSPVVVGNLLTTENGYSVSCKVVRTDNSGSTTVDVSLENTEEIDGLFALENTSVTFEQGKSEAYVKVIPLVGPAEINPAQTYEFNLSLTGENASNLYNSTTYTATLKVDYFPLGTGTFVSSFFEGQWDVEIHKAELGSITLYKAIDLYDSGYNVTFVVDGSGIAINGQAAWYYDSDYGDVHVQGDGTIKGKVMTLSLEHFLPGVYSWGPWPEVLTLP